jgi:hypothetical protein
MMKKPRRRPAARAAKTETLITIAEAAQLLHRRPATVRRLRRQGLIEAKLVLNEVRIVKESVERLLKPRPYKPTRPAPQRQPPTYGTAPRVGVTPQVEATA